VIEYSTKEIFMIGRLSGVLIEKTAESVLLDVQGVGYELLCPLTTIEKMPKIGENCTLAVKTYVREDQITLFGFNDMRERKLFEELTSVSGIGPKLAVSCLSGLSADQIREAIITANVKNLSSIPGIGKKTAERMVLELRSKFEKSYAVREAVVVGDEGSGIVALQSALKNLGYKEKEIDHVVDQLREKAQTLSLEELIREALNLLIF
jgi:Holliday junction DNA helicase RuvA